MTQKKPMVLIGLLVLLSVISVVAIGVTSFFSGFSGKGTRHKKTAQSLFVKETRIGVIEVNGMILDSKKILEQLEDFEEASDIKAILVRVNSPGGAVAPSQEIYDAFRNCSKPIYSSMSSLAASGGYYISLGTKKIFAEPGTITGSIGVIMQFADLSKLYDLVKVSPYNIKTGKFKDIGSTERAMSADERALLQGMMDNVLAQFRKAVVDSRKLSMEHVIALSDGRIFSGEQAKEAKLIDELGGIRETAKALVAEVNGSGKPVLVYPAKKMPAFIEHFLQDDEDSAEGSASILSRKSLFSAIFIELVSQVLGVPIGQHFSSATSMGLESQSLSWGPMYMVRGFR